jgi:hypothetical protein
MDNCREFRIRHREFTAHGNPLQPQLAAARAASCSWANIYELLTAPEPGVEGGDEASGCVVAGGAGDDDADEADVISSSR